MHLLIATTNRHKAAEIRALLAGLPLRVDTLADHPGVEAPEETGATFADNARLKALAYNRQTGRAAVADDSGLEIDALDGAPGVRSARYNGASYPEKFAAIYGALRKQGARTSTARFVCALALADGGRIVFETRGVVEGEIAPAPAGAAGFGYDPIFYYPPRGSTFGELPPADKAAISHRGRAFRALRDHLAAVRGETPRRTESGEARG